MDARLPLPQSPVDPQLGTRAGNPRPAQQGTHLIRQGRVEQSVTTVERLKRHTLLGVQPIRVCHLSLAAQRAIAQHDQRGEVDRRPLGHSAQAYYAWLAAPVSRRDLQEAYLINALIDAHEDDPEFGYRWEDEEPAARAGGDCYLVRSGGFYVDADEVYKGGGCDFLFDDDQLKVQPLCYDTTTGEMVAADIFMQSQDAQPGWIYYVNNNPIVAPPGHAVLRRALARASQLLLDGSASRLGVQSTTGPGNLTACLVAHEVERAGTEVAPDYAFLPQWDSLSVSRWPLSYRHDARNWRLWDPST